MEAGKFLMYLIGAISLVVVGVLSGDSIVLVLTVSIATTLMSAAILSDLSKQIYSELYSATGILELKDYVELLKEGKRK